MRGKATRNGMEMLSALEMLVSSAVRERLAGCGIPADRIETLAARVGYETAEMVRKSYGGGQIYIPMDRARRNAEIYREFTGDNHFELARKYRMTLNSIYKILRSEKARRSVKYRQLSLLGEERL
jgi:Mor family transcriptional regulator